MNDTLQQPAANRPPSGSPGGWRVGWARTLLGLVLVALIAASITLVVVVTNDDDEVSTGSATTTAPSSTTSEAPTTEPAPPDSSTTTDPRSATRPVIVADGYIMGYWDGIDWIALTGQEGEQLPNPEAEEGTPYLFVDATGGELRTSLGPVSAGCYLGTSWAIADDAASGRVGIPLGRDALPRSVVPIQPSDDHVNAVRAWLTSQGEEHPVVSIDRALRVDIEGDGRDEVFVEASMNADGEFQDEPGAYSVLLYRYVDDEDEARTVVVAGDYVGKDDLDSELAVASSHRILGILDLNEDGRLEIVTKSNYYEGEEVTVSIVYSPNLVTVLSTGCGA